MGLKFWIAGPRAVAVKPQRDDARCEMICTPTEIEITCCGVKPTKRKLVYVEVFEVMLSDWG